MLHESEGAEPEDCDTGDGVGSPVTVDILLDGLMEHTVTTINIKLIIKGFIGFIYGIVHCMTL